MDFESFGTVLSFYAFCCVAIGAAAVGLLWWVFG